VSGLDVLPFTNPVCFIKQIFVVLYQAKEGFVVIEIKKTKNKRLHQLVCCCLKSDIYVLKDLKSGMQDSLKVNVNVFGITNVVSMLRGIEYDWVGGLSKKDGPRHEVHETPKARSALGVSWNSCGGSSFLGRPINEVDIWLT